ncbi:MULTISPECIES: hypothetical protein [Thermoactinomyces]|uniref:Uncharacterized protein n=1 Tax=Thermoactinomyces daqus TaxID=1329516 RepID=A0A7W2AK25_9BACL|nr:MULTISPECIES: hypothetical protein [Thermoactinomyces]MBA4544409.1 hypothetical protein [Thermoactinomyces daqus]MBH8598184.1 hypothetical protein [Thermoactinomyces sp. CICC 10523]MBH8603213.1 hypothetical protein [Thermoactinomyces sp. CICC 10522]MBH8608631.1 hypothetical protein [Thermoactinomyces sp. CICC 10521]
MEERAEKIRRQADIEEYKLRKVIATDPHPVYTDMDDFCDVCCLRMNRIYIRIVDDFKDMDDNGIRACLDCIEKYDLKVLSNQKAIEYEAMTEAKIRIKKGTQIKF